MNSLFIGMNGHVVSIDKTSGTENWRVKLKSASITVVSSDDERVYAAAGGHLFCLDIQTGQQLWTNELKGLGYGTCIIDSNAQAISAGHTVNTSASVATTTAATAAVVASGSAAAGDGA